MPRQNRYKRKQRSRPRRSYRRKNRAGMGDKGKRFFKLRTALSLTSNISGTIEMAASNDPTLMGDWSSVAALFDSYKVAAIKVKFIPALPNNNSTATAYVPFYVVADANSLGIPINSVTSACQYENMKAVNLYRPWKYYYKFPSQSSAGGSNPTLTGGYRDSQNSTTATAGVFGWGAGYTNSTTYGSYIITQYITAKQRR